MPLILQFHSKFDPSPSLWRISSSVRLLSISRRFESDLWSLPVHYPSFQPSWPIWRSQSGTMPSDCVDTWMWATELWLLILLLDLWSLIFSGRFPLGHAGRTGHASTKHLRCWDRIWITRWSWSLILVIKCNLYFRLKRSSFWGIFAMRKTRM